MLMARASELILCLLLPKDRNRTVPVIIISFVHSSFHESHAIHSVSQSFINSFIHSAIHSFIALFHNNPQTPLTIRKWTEEIMDLFYIILCCFEEL